MQYGEDEEPKEVLVIVISCVMIANLLSYNQPHDMDEGDFQDLE